MARVASQMPRSSLAAIDSLTLDVISDNVSDTYASKPAFAVSELANIMLAGAKEISGQTLLVANLGYGLRLRSRLGTADHVLLFDTGTEGAAFVRNCRNLAIDLAGVEEIVVTHGHWDHMGALPAALDAIVARRGRNSVGVHVNPGMFNERGVLLAQMLSPATPAEILGARYLFYPVLAVALAAVLAGTYSPAVLLRPFFWAALVVCVVGSMGIGLTIGSLARTQRAASMGAMCYMLAVALILFICQQNGIPGLSYLALEYHCPRMVHAALTDAVLWYHYGHLLGAGVLAVGWTGAATLLFRRCGWQ